MVEILPASEPTVLLLKVFQSKSHYTTYTVPGLTHLGRSRDSNVAVDRVVVCYAECSPSFVMTVASREQRAIVPAER